MDRKYHALVCCRAGMGSSMMLKIKCDQVIKEEPQIYKPMQISWKPEQGQAEYHPG